MTKHKLAIYKFTSCDGCQLAFLNAGEDLLTLTQLVDIVHFAEAGYVNPNAKVDIAFVEGSISTPKEERLIEKVRKNSKYVITIGACATAGGIQALRNFANVKQWMQSIYAQPQYINTLASSSAIAKHIKVDLELWGCPVNTQQVMTAIRSLLYGVPPVEDRDSVCMQCKQAGNVCVLVAKGEPCLGPITLTGCGALCPKIGRECYGCYGPKENANPKSLGKRLQGFGLLPESIAKRLQQINSQADAFLQGGNYFKGIKIDSSDK